MIWLLTASAAAQSVAELTQQLATAEAYEGEWVGERRSDTYDLYLKLTATASADQLVTLTAHDAPIVRCYAVRALVAGGHVSQLPGIVTDHLDDLDALRIRNRDAAYESSAGDLIFELARPRLAARELMRLAERMVREDCQLAARNWALHNLRFDRDMHEVIRKLAVAGDRAATVALARYRNADDVEVLVEQLRQPRPFDQGSLFLAAEISRDRRLMSELEKLEAAALKRLGRDSPGSLLLWLRAITAQRSGRALDFLTHLVLSRPTSDPDKLDEFRATILEAIEEHPDPLFAELAAELRDQCP